MTFDTETTAGFLAARLPWLRFDTIDLPDGGWDVVLRIDGTYSNTADEFGMNRDALLAYFTEWLRNALVNDGVIAGDRNRISA